MGQRAEKTRCGLGGPGTWDHFCFFSDRGPTCFFSYWSHLVLLAIGPTIFFSYWHLLFLKGQPGPNINYFISLPKCRKISKTKSSQNVLRTYPELLPHQLRHISTYRNPPISHIGKNENCITFVIFKCSPILSASPYKSATQLHL